MPTIEDFDAIRKACPWIDALQIVVGSDYPPDQKIIVKVYPLPVTKEEVSALTIALVRFIPAYGLIYDPYVGEYVSFFMPRSESIRALYPNGLPVRWSGFKKIVMLDIDGVLNTDTTPEPPDDPQGDEERRHHGWILPEKVKILNYITDKHDAAIVVHSSWRRVFDDAALSRILHACGVTGLVIGSTRRSLHRESSIVDWLASNPGHAKHFVILDDTYKMRELPICDHHVVVNPQTGLDDKYIAQVDDVMALDRKVF